MIIYLHGFRSGPQSWKSRSLKARMDALGIGEAFWGRGIATEAVRADEAGEPAMDSGDHRWRPLAAQLLGLPARLHQAGHEDHRKRQRARRDRGGDVLVARDAAESARADDQDHRGGQHRARDGRPPPARPVL